MNVISQTRSKCIFFSLILLFITRLYHFCQFIFWILVHIIHISSIYSDWQNVWQFSTHAQMKYGYILIKLLTWFVCSCLFHPTSTFENGNEMETFTHQFLCGKFSNKEKWLLAKVNNLTNETNRTKRALNLYKNATSMVYASMV